MKNKRIAFGEYNRCGYEVRVWSGNHTLFCERYGNSPYDSKFHVPVEEGLSLRRIRALCQITTRDVAKIYQVTTWNIERKPEES